jgi:hypothetical protein
VARADKKSTDRFQWINRLLALIARPRTNQPSISCFSPLLISEHFSLPP